MYVCARTYTHKHVPQLKCPKAKDRKPRGEKVHHYKVTRINAAHPQNQELGGSGSKGKLRVPYSLQSYLSRR